MKCYLIYLMNTITINDYISEAVTSISHYFKENKLNGYKIKDIEQTELVIINKDNMNQIKEHYR